MYEYMSYNSGEVLINCLDNLIHYIIAIKYTFSMSLYSSIKYVLIGSRCFPNGAHTNHLLSQFSPFLKQDIHVWRKSIPMIALWCVL